MKTRVVLLAIAISLASSATAAVHRDDRRRIEPPSFPRQTMEFRFAFACVWRTFFLVP